MNEQNQIPKFIGITGIELHDGETYWYPSVTYCCHFSKTTVHDFVFKKDDLGNLQFALNEPLYRTENEARTMVNKIRSLFGYSKLK